MKYPETLTRKSHNLRMGGASRPRSRRQAPSSRVSTNQRVADPEVSAPSVVVPQFSSEHPRQVMITRADSPVSGTDSDEQNECTFTFAVIPRKPKTISRFSRQESNFELELSKFSDLDYILPQEVSDILKEEGVDETTVKAWLNRREAWHRRAEALRQFGSAKAVKTTRQSRPTKRSEPLLLPPIISEAKGQRGRPVSKSPRRTDTRQSSLSPRPSLTPSPALQALPDIKSREPSADSRSKSEMEDVVSQMDEMRWRSEQQLEKWSLPAHGYMAPRLVLISSKVPWCQSMARAVRKDGYVLCTVYDFETWSFKDLIEACRAQLDNYRRDCKAKSILLICKGGPGYLYILQNFVLTPQKLGKSRYKSMKEFWCSVGNMVSKLSPEDAYIHVLGGDLENSTQGKALKSAITKVIKPNRVKLESVTEICPAEQAIIGLYFDYRKFLLWRSHAVSDLELADSLDGTRSWSSIEEEAHRKMYIH